MADRQGPPVPRVFRCGAVTIRVRRTQHRTLHLGEHGCLTLRGQQPELPVPLTFVQKIPVSSNFWLDYDTAEMRLAGHTAKAVDQHQAIGGHLLAH
jgi:hypothetical protein